MIILLFVFFLIIYSLRKLIKPFLMSPLWLFISFHFTCIVFSYIYYYFVPLSKKINLFNVDRVTSTQFDEVIFYFLLSLVFFSLGALLNLFLLKKKYRRSLRQNLSKSLFLNIKLQSYFSWTINIVFVIIILLYMSVYGSELFLRETYLGSEIASRHLSTLLKFLSLIEVVLLGIVFNNSPKKSLLMFVMLVFLSLGTGSRILVVYCIAYNAIVYINSRGGGTQTLRAVAGLFLTLILYAFVIEFRSQHRHGLYPYLLSVLGDGVNKGFVYNFLFNIYYALIFGVFATVETLEKGVRDWGIIRASLSPLPGFMTDFYSYVPKLKLNQFAPFTYYGQVFLMGKTFSILFSFLSGCVFLRLEIYVRYFLVRGNKIFAFILSFFVFLQIIYSTQYLLRSGVRYFYYLFIIIFLFKFISRVKFPKIRLR
ncbi:hypothetical protein [Sediminitomix flava]|uniref:Oligosaccharide repeat unit polymerase n=1 Tax=Sediminitomix flava TaxID=379075 RepID=A0A315Z859_SEDFL|nr:hypothetical protein [Sediminitomix flava]PWJ40936.1 hypothetical protein BC781_104202 [Sediminitomix flava]